MTSICRPDTSGSPSPRTLCLAWLGLLVAASGAAQTPVDTAQAYVQAHIANWRLTVQPHQVATGTRTAQAGNVVLGSFRLYVPSQCVGTRRCPLVVIPFYPAEEIWPTMLAALADQHGMLLLHQQEQQWANFVDYVIAAPPVDSVLRVILQTYAVDPDKIALLGNDALRWGHLNLDVFSRIAAIEPASGPILYAMLPPANRRGPRVQFFVSGALEEYGFGSGTFRAAQALRDSGYVVRHVINLKEHAHRQEDWETAWRWLAESWAQPDPQTRRTPRARPDSLSLLTPKALAQLLDFWHRFIALPDSIGGMLHPPVNAVAPGRKPFLEEVPLMVGHFPVIVQMTNMPKLAAHYPEVAAALKAAGLTAEQHDAYRAALISAIATWNYGLDRRGMTPWNGFNRSADEGAGLPMPPMPRALLPDPGSVLARNVAFLQAHPMEADSLSWWSAKGVPNGGLVLVGPTVNP